MSITIRRGMTITLGDKATIKIEESMGDGFQIDIEYFPHAERHKLWIGMPFCEGERHYPFWEDVMNVYRKHENEKRTEFPGLDSLISTGQDSNRDV